MLLKPQGKDLKIIGYYLGKIFIGIGLFMLLPIFTCILFKEINPLFDFASGMCVTLILGLLLNLLCKTDDEPNWMHGLIVVSLSWLGASLLGAIPLYLSGHWQSYLDAVFDAMSGFATTGLALVQDLDHLSFGHNLWRHLIMFLGGQGIIVFALSFLVRGFAGAFKMYVGEAREERVLPNVIGTARFIWILSIVYLIFGTLILGGVAILEGMKPARAFFHSACIFMAAFDTGGFSPQSQNILYYHSFPFEIVTIVFMILGALNFKLHYALWTGNRREIRRNIESVTFFITLMITFFIVARGLVKSHTYPTYFALFRKGFYQLISAHTGTGFMNIYAAQFIKEWATLALLGIVMAMSLGGSSCSTTGGIKILRIGIVGKAFLQDIKKIILPESTVTQEKFHHIKDVILEDKQVRAALLILVSYLGLYFLGALIGCALGYPFLEALFESTSAAANVGLSCGITRVSMPGVLKLTYIFQMWIGRLEFMSIFTLLGFLVAWIKGRR
ncbi:MAG: TrkH family potassium uptake protein [Candidatus Omnitrophica bacterium]|nr:TrkH family potassium uptake protein [Candidatus Omnitrophota bacterium]MCM8771005.1 TrkH family potassium uptake protein [Candidatus Omnitrophota bacterium]